MFRDQRRACGQVVGRARFVVSRRRNGTNSETKNVPRQYVGQLTVRYAPGSYIYLLTILRPCSNFPSRRAATDLSIRRRPVLRFRLASGGHFPPPNGFPSVPSSPLQQPPHPSVWRRTTGERARARPFIELPLPSPPPGSRNTRARTHATTAADDDWPLVVVARAARNRRRRACAIVPTTRASLPPSSVVVVVAVATAAVAATVAKQRRCGSFVRSRVLVSAGRLARSPGFFFIFFIIFF